MLSILALVAFLLALFHAKVGSLDLVVLGLVFLAAHFAFGEFLPWHRRGSR